MSGRSPMATISVSSGSVNSVPGTGTGVRRPLASSSPRRFRMHSMPTRRPSRRRSHGRDERFQSTPSQGRLDPPATWILTGETSVSIVDAFLEGGLDFLLEGGHLVPRAAVEDRDALDVLLAQRHAGGVDGRVAAADDAHAPAGQFLAAQVEGLEELHGRDRRPRRPRPSRSSCRLLCAPMARKTAWKPSANSASRVTSLPRAVSARSRDVLVQERGDFLAQTIPRGSR